MKGRYLLDTTALLALRDDAEGADLVEEILRKAELGVYEVFVSFITLTEIYHRVWVDEGERAAKKIYLELQTLPIARIDVDDDLIRGAARVRAQVALSLPDAWIIATAERYGATLVHKDPHFEAAADLVHLISLPYERK
ncbi:MAG: PIN domain-containing protein [Candidatus Wallbacteria bacterium]|nr:PIN domain-containing protein [Candidatus Wallbacteria bacterium]MBI4865723.1 PIN domain-containing protein [Candidatus Wallbacteria bacterium]